MTNKVYRAVVNHSDGRVDHTEFADWNDASERVDESVCNGGAIGGDVHEFVDGIGWVLCNDEPECDDCELVWDHDQFDDYIDGQEMTF
jgi:hypothetical protein